MKFTVYGISILDCFSGGCVGEVFRLASLPVEGREVCDAVEKDPKSFTTFLIRFVGDHGVWLMGVLMLGGVAFGMLFLVYSREIM